MHVFLPPLLQRLKLLRRQGHPKAPLRESPGELLRPLLRKGRLRRTVGHREPDPLAPKRVRRLQNGRAEGIFVLSLTGTALREPERFRMHVHDVCFSYRKAFGRVPMSRNLITETKSALKTNPRLPSSTLMPSCLASLSMYSGIGFDIGRAHV